jgi:V8-like Glu-specific endopeptidase
MRRVLRAALPSAAVVVLTLTAGAAVVAMASGDGGGAVNSHVNASETAQTQSYWTPARMAAATPAATQPVAGTALRKAATTVSGYPTAHLFGGARTVGALFLHSATTGDHYCTASVVDSTKRDLIITAAHCILPIGKPIGHSTYYTNVAYVPMYDHGKTPYGIWPATARTVHSYWIKNRDPDVDFGFFALSPQNGKEIGNVTGYNTLKINNGYTTWVDVIGYPDTSLSPFNRPVWCGNRTSRAAQYQIRFDCNGMYNGTSGSPYLHNYNSRTQSGQLIGVLGGMQGGGGYYPYTSYAAYFDSDVWNLRARANQT